MKPPPFEYCAPLELGEAIQLLTQSENARLLAGGQSLMAMLNMRFVFPDRLIDLNRVAALDYIREDESEIVIGAMTRQRTLEMSPLLTARMPLFAKALRHVGHLQTRNRGTLGGSLCQLDPAAELPALAMTYDAVVEAAGPGGTRAIAFADFPASFMTPALAADEIMTGVRFRPWSGRVGSGFREFARRHGDFAIAGAFVLLSASADLTIEKASVTLFGIGTAPVRALAAEAQLVGQRSDRELFHDVAHHCVGLATLDDPYSRAEYRGHVAAAMAEEALAEAAAELAVLRTAE